MKQIATVEADMAGVQQIRIEITGGKVHKLPVRLRDKKQLRELILEQL